jgi:hypothetical protein
MDFLQEYQAAISLAGTVMFPSPFPAAARVTIVKPPEELRLGGHFIKIVQVVSQRQFTIWLTPLDTLRAARVPAPAAASVEPGPFAGWSLRIGNELKTDIETALAHTEQVTGGAGALLYPRASVFVAESAPVIVRCEIVTIARDAAEECCDFFCPVCPPPHCP